MTGATGNWRDVYQYAINSEVFLDADNIRSLMARGVTAQSNGSEDMAVPTTENLLALLHDCKKGQLLQYQQLFKSCENAGVVEELQRILLRQTTVMASTLGCWLQGMSAPGVFEDPLQLKIMALLACDVGVGRPEASRYDEFKSLLRRHHLSAYAIPPSELPSLQSINDRFFMLPALLLAMSRRSDEFAPEIYGVDLCLRASGLFPCWQALKSHNPEAIDWNRLDLSAPGINIDSNNLFETSAAIVNSARSKSADFSARIDTGITWCMNALKQWNQSLLDLCSASLDPEYAMAILVQERAREASIYHHKFELEGQTLSAWFKQAQDDPVPFVRVLANSRLVRPGQPDRSILINSLVKINGPMFRIFSHADIRVLRRWIEYIGKSEMPIQQAQQQFKAVSENNINALSTRPGDSSLGLKPNNIREAYFLLQGRAMTPQTREFATDYIEEWLEHAQASVGHCDRSLPTEWSPGVLRTWLLNRHDQHSRNFEQSDDSEMPSRDDIINSSLQLAPLTLIDGSWLQGFTDCQLASSRAGFYLFETYWDELGNGNYEINHPKIYRDVLKQMDIELPPTHSMEFALNNRIDDESFRLPVYWLCIGKLPATYLTTILGMNLAMELSGVGGSYRSANRFLKHYGFSTLFVDIHNTIDNISTGHSAWAASAIDAHMQQISTFGDDQLIEHEWHMVRAGYESLSPQSSRKFDRGYFSSSKNSAPDSTLFFEQAQLYHHDQIGVGV